VLELSEEQAVYDLVERCETPPRWESRDVSNPAVPAGPTSRYTSEPPSSLPSIPERAALCDAAVDRALRSDLGPVAA